MRVDQKEIDVDVTANANYPVASGGAVAAISLEHIYGFSAVINALAAQAGTLTLQVSNDTENTLKTNPSAAVWAPLPSGAFTINGAAVQVGNFDAQYWRWLRINYAKISGAGIIQVLLNWKGN